MKTQFVRLGLGCYLWCQTTAVTNRTQDRREYLFKMAAGVPEVAWQTPFTIGSSQRLANRARAQRADSTGLREDRRGGSRKKSDGMGALKKTVKEKWRELFSVITHWLFNNVADYFLIHTQRGSGGKRCKVWNIYRKHGSFATCQMWANNLH